MPSERRPKRKKAAGRHRANPEPVGVQFGARLRRLRREANFTFDAFVEETGLGRGYVSELERGMAVPTLVTLGKIARALELPVADLLLGDSLREQLYEAMRSLGEGELKHLRAEIERLRGAARS